jgi:hypothetical protein
MKLKSSLNLLTLAENPSTGREGDVYFNIITKNIRIYNGEFWVDITPKSDDPTPFYMHTHAYDGSVHTVNTQNPINFKNTNTIQSVLESTPLVVGFDGGGPGDEVDFPKFENLSLLSGGAPDSLYYPESDSVVINGGDSSSQDASTINGGDSSGN